MSAQAKLYLATALALLLWLGTAWLNTPERHPLIVWEYLLAPRLSAALISGCVLGLAGAILQIITRNPLSSPSVLGVTSGAQIGLLFSLLLPAAWQPLGMVPILAGGMAGAALTFVIAGSWRAPPLRLVLAGTASNIFLAALSTLLLVLNEQHIAGLAVWQAGSLFQEDFQKIGHIFPWLVAAAILMLLYRKPLAMLVLGEQQSDVLGVNVPRVRRNALFAAILLTAIAVTLAGPIAFVGLIAPHLARAMGFKHPHALLRASLFTGMAVLCAADALTQWLSVYGSIPLGLMTAAVGAPVLILLVLRQPLQPEKPQTQHLSPKQRHTYLPLPVAAILLFAAMYFSLIYGWPQNAGNVDSAIYSMLFEMRSNRISLAAGCGLLLALGGWLMQQILRNPLASPEITGITQGAALAVLLTLLFYKHTDQWLLTAAALTGSLLILLLIAWFTRHQPFHPSRLLICGLALSGMLTAIITLIIVMFKIQAAQAVVWLTGSLYGQTGYSLHILAAALLLLLAAMLFIRKLTLLQLGDHQAQVLGVPVSQVRAAGLIIATVATAIAVSFAGPVAFVALLAPHLANHWVGRQNLGLSLGTSLVFGALLCVLADFLGRSLFAPTDIPLGLMTTLLGAPYLLALMAAQKKEAS